jgi:RHS repeat-associated protein
MLLVCPTQATDGRGDTTTYTWNSDAELTQVTPSSGPATSYGYDSDGDLTSRSGPAGSDTFTWNTLGQLATSANPSGDTTNYGYDATGNLTSLQDVNGTTSYTFNQVNEPTSIADPWGGTTGLSYASGDDTQLAKITFPNGVAESFGYDKSGRTTSLNAATSGGTTLVKETYSYTSSSGSDTALIHTQTDTAWDTTTYGYDAVDRVTSAGTTSSSGSSVSSYGYGYDGAGNMTSATVNGTTTSYSYNAASELTSQGASYDGAGNLTGGAGFSSLAYNAAGQTTTVTPSGGSAASLSYTDNSQNQLFQAGGTTLDQNALGIASTTDSYGNTTGYLYDPEGHLLAEHTGSGSTYYYLLGNLGSVLGLTDSSGNLVNSYTYDPYGQQTTTQSSAPNLFGYAGGLQVPGTGLIHFGARYYNPALGQWTQLDPTGQSPGYTYAADNPVNYVDLTGNDAYFAGCVTGMATGVLIGLAGPDETGIGLVAVAAAGCAEGVIATAFDQLTGTYFGTVGSAIKDVTDFLYGL